MAFDTSSSHQDLRSAALPYKRAKDFNSKWNLGIRYDGSFPADAEEEKTCKPQESPFRVRPEHPWSKHYPKKKKEQNVSFKAGHAAGLPADLANRYERRRAAQNEIASSESTLSASLLSVIPSLTRTYTSDRIRVAAEADAGIMYSFDAPHGPTKTVGLDALIDQAEQRFHSRETDKIVRDEYELLDGDGETVVVRTGKKGKKGSPKQHAVVETPLDNEDFELV